MTWLLVAVGGALGATTRWWIGQRLSVPAGRFPAGTFAVNVAGSFLLGAVLAATVDATGRAELVAFLGTGVAGAFTTTSTFAVEVVALVEAGARRVAVAYALGSLVAGVLAAALGWQLAG